MTDSAISIKDQAAHLRTNGFWIGRTYSDTFVRNLYDLAARNLITPEQWNTYGDASKSWDKQSRAILMISKTAGPAKAASTEEKAAVLKISGFWIDGKAVGEGVVDNLYALHASGKINPDEWNKLGVATLPWDKQSAAITSRMDSPAETPRKEPQPPAPPTEESVPDTVPDAEPAPAVTETEPAPIPAEPEPTPPPVEETPVEEVDVPAVTEEAVPEEVVPAEVEEPVEEAVVPAVPETAEEETKEAPPATGPALANPSPAREPAPAPAEPAPPATPAAVKPAEAPETKTEVAEELSAEEKQKQIGELLELRETVKNLIYMKEWRNPQYIKEKIKHKRHFLQLQREKIEEIDAQISALDPQAVPRDRVLWKPWTWDMFNN